VVVADGKLYEVSEKDDITTSLEALLARFKDDAPSLFILKKDVERFIKTLSILQSEEGYSLISVVDGKLSGMTASRSLRDHYYNLSEAPVVIKEFRTNVLDLGNRTSEFPVLPFSASLLTEVFRRLKTAEVEKTGMSIFTAPDERNPGGSFVLFATEAPHTVLAILSEKQKEWCYPFVMVLTLTAFRDTVESFIEEARK
jgi:hypothetical protein